MIHFTPDLINGSFEFIGGACNWLNVTRYFKDRRVTGIFWPSSIFYALWGIWNLFYYPTLHQPISFMGGVFLTSGTVTWLLLVIHDLYKYRTRQGHG